MNHGQAKGSNVVVPKGCLDMDMPENGDDTFAREDLRDNMVYRRPPVVLPSRTNNQMNCKIINFRFSHLCRMHGVFYLV